MSSQMLTWVLAASGVLLALAFAYLTRLNSLLKSTPADVQRLTGAGWTAEQLRDTYDRLNKQGFDRATRLPRKLDRRYIITGGNGLVGGYIVLQLLARGTPAQNIRIIDIRKSSRHDLNTGPAADVEFVQTDITSVKAVNAAFEKPWHNSVQDLPLTVFHTAAIITASDRSEYLYGFPEAVNVKGTKNVLAAAKAAGADVFSATSSASIAILPVVPPMPWQSEVPNHAQLLDERDFSRPLRPRSEFYGNYPLSKAVGERLICEANSDSFRTGTIRPANGVYGHPTDNTVGVPLSRTVLQTWVSHIVQSFVHAENVAVAHLHHEAVLAEKDASAPQTGRPYVVTDPNPPITYNDLYTAIKVLSRFPFETVQLPPGLMLLISYLVEWYCLLPFHLPILGNILPSITSDLKLLQPGLFSICTHAVGIDTEARKPVAEGGLGYEGLLTTMEGMTLEILDYNRDHQDEPTGPATRKAGGLELLFSNQKTQKFSLPSTTAGRPTTVADLIQHLATDVVQQEKKDLFVLGDSVRPGILVLINDADWELEGEGAYELKDGDNIVFVSTLHGG
ncbi:URM1-like protein [Elsinoe fawcettii]|nr:URM1-like protein [Elsinoe fawcettii]